MAFAEFRVSVVGDDGRTSKPRKFKADVDDPTVGDAILLGDRWHEVVRVAHLPVERAGNIGAVVLVKPYEVPPGFLLDLARGGRTVPPTEPGKVLPLPSPDPFKAPTVQREVRPSQLLTVVDEARANVPTPVEPRKPTTRVFMVEPDPTGQPTMRQLREADAPVVARATGIHERPTAIAYPRPPLVPKRPAPPPRKRSRLPWLVVPLAASVVAAALAWRWRPRHVAPAAIPTPSAPSLRVEPLPAEPPPAPPVIVTVQSEAAPAPPKRRRHHAKPEAPAAPTGDRIFESAE